MGWRDYQFAALDVDEAAAMVEPSQQATMAMTKPGGDQDTRRPERCPICGEFSWWESVHGLLICGMCHPPVAGALKRWIGDPGILNQMKSDRSGMILSWEEIRKKRMG